MIRSVRVVLVVSAVVLMTFVAVDRTSGACNLGGYGMCHSTPASWYRDSDCDCIGAPPACNCGQGPPQTWCLVIHCCRGETGAAGYGAARVPFPSARIFHTYRRSMRKNPALVAGTSAISDGGFTKHERQTDNTSC
jgi:hypothetical protein